MGIIRNLLTGGGLKAVSQSVVDVAETFRPNATRQMELSHAGRKAALEQLGDEFQRSNPGWFHLFVDGLNRLPRPALALGTLGLFVYAMVDPSAFSERMQGLALVPDPLWWLLGAIVSFYFGARELHYRRQNKPQIWSRKKAQKPEAEQAAERSKPRKNFKDNAALQDWANGQ